MSGRYSMRDASPHLELLASFRELHEVMMHVDTWVLAGGVCAIQFEEAARPGQQ